MAEGESQACYPAEDIGGPGETSRVSRHRRAVLAVCLAHAPSTQDAEDAMQDAFVKALAKIDTLRDPQKARPWLFQIARRVCADRWRGTRPNAPLPDDIPVPVNVPDPRIERLHAALARLPDDFREAITLYYLDGRNSAAVAESLGVTPVAIRQRLVRARLMLHDLLSEDSE